MFSTRFACFRENFPCGSLILMKGNVKDTSDTNDTKDTKDTNDTTDTKDTNDTTDTKYNSYTDSSDDSGDSIEILVPKCLWKVAIKWTPKIISIC